MSVEMGTMERPWLSPVERKERVEQLAFKAYEKGVIGYWSLGQILTLIEDHAKKLGLREEKVVRNLSELRPPSEKESVFELFRPDIVRKLCLLECFASPGFVGIPDDSVEGMEMEVEGEEMYATFVVHDAIYYEWEGRKMSYFVPLGFGKRNSIDFLI